MGVVRQLHDVSPVWVSRCKDRLQVDWGRPPGVAHVGRDGHGDWAAGISCSGGGGGGGGHSSLRRDEDRVQSATSTALDLKRSFV